MEYIDNVDIFDFKNIRQRKAFRTKHLLLVYQSSFTIRVFEQ